MKENNDKIIEKYIGKMMDKKEDEFDIKIFEEALNEARADERKKLLETLR